VKHTDSFRYAIALIVFVLLTLAAYIRLTDRPSVPEPDGVYVHLFEWSWPDIAQECESFLGPAGYSAVQASPAQEHVTGDQWWTRYQPVSYRLESRGGSRVEFEDMVRRCRAAGVAVYADAVINHMSGVGEGAGVAGSNYGRYEYPVPYGFDHFHHCGRYGDDDIENYQDAWEVRNCELANLADLKTDNEYVRDAIADYLGDLLNAGVTGFRIDAAKHMDPADITAILDRLPVQPFVVQEVIDRGSEPIKGLDYVSNGQVTEFRYGIELFSAFTEGDLTSLKELGSAEGWLPSNRAVVFVDNHDVQRGHAGAENILTHENWAAYQLANIFMLAWPYGYPMVMSSYRFNDSDQGPPTNRPVNESGGCSEEWVCEHRDPAIAAMVGFRSQTRGEPISGWTQISDSAIAFSRGERGFLAVNAGDTAVNARITVGLPPGRYQNLVGSTDSPESDLVVAEDRTVSITLPPMSAAAAHVGGVR